MENLGTIQFLVETVERLTKEGTTYKVELEHTKERVAALEEESAKKDVRISELEARVEELEKTQRGCEGAQCGHEEGRRLGCR